MPDGRGTVNPLWWGNGVRGSRFFVLGTSGSSSSCFRYRVFFLELVNTPKSQEIGKSVVLIFGSDTTSSDYASKPFTDGELRSIERAIKDKGWLPWCTERPDYGQELWSPDTFLDAYQENLYMEGDLIDDRWRKHAEHVAYFVNSEESRQPTFKIDASTGEGQDGRMGAIPGPEPRAEATAENIYRCKDYSAVKSNPSLQYIVKGHSSRTVL
ncbi:hypothetical protein BKA65DRAFT_157178 [Rhexocercosporidium sp. MPI-PUGE-AT-0058]|nr:hypothetical protein BKA65DRAFT_157178 [Rhexocercosporidium sp. MPI-PUGE-AT-0058]